MKINNMKRIVLVLTLFPILSLAQDNMNEEVLSRIVPSSIPISEYENSKPAYFVDGKRVDKSMISKLEPSEILYINVSKIDKKYPNGKIEITLKSKHI